MKKSDKGKKVFGVIVILAVIDDWNDNTALFDGGRKVLESYSVKKIKLKDWKSQFKSNLKPFFRKESFTKETI